MCKSVFSSTAWHKLCLPEVGDLEIFQNPVPKLIETKGIISGTYFDSAKVKFSYGHSISNSSTSLILRFWKYLVLMN